MGSRFSGCNSAYKNSHLIVAGKGNFSGVINAPLKCCRPSGNYFRGDILVFIMAFSLSKMKRSIGKYWEMPFKIRDFARSLSTFKGCWRLPGDNMQISIKSRWLL